MFEEIYKIVVTEKTPWKFLHEWLQQHLQRSRYAGSGMAAVIINNVIATPSSIVVGGGVAVAALQLRRGANKIQAIARDHDWFWFWLALF